MRSYKCAMQLWRRKQSDLARVFFLPKISRAFHTQKTSSDQLLGMVQSGVARQSTAHCSSHLIWSIIGADSIPVLSGRKFTRKLNNTQWNPLPLTRNYRTNHNVNPYFRRTAKKDISTVEEPYDDDITYNIPQKPLTFVAGASYGVVVLLGLGIAGMAAYFVSKELIFEENEYTIFSKAFKRIQDDAKCRVKVGYPITGYGQQSSNTTARQHIPNRIWTDEDGLKHVLVNFCVRGPQGAGDVHAVMFKDTDEKWKYKYLVVETRAPSQSRLILESEGILDYISLYFGHVVPAS